MLTQKDKMLIFNNANMEKIRMTPYFETDKILTKIIYLVSN